MIEWIAVDWGTSALRVWAMQGERAVAERHSSEGMGKLQPAQFEPALLRLIDDWLPKGLTRVVACGMVGARQGWQEAAYRQVPTRPVDGPFLHIRPKDARLSVHVIPGLCQDSPADVMRGEETQIAGFLKGAPDYSGAIGLPGTHMKWVNVAEEKVWRFQTSMTGEVFALLSEQSVLRHGLGDGWDDTAFAAAVTDMRKTPDQLMARLFSVRAGGLLGQSSRDAARATLSGLLIGAELAATRAIWSENAVTLIGADGLAKAYWQALALFDHPATLVDAAGMTLAGLTQAYHMLKDSPQ